MTTINQSNYRKLQKFHQGKIFVKGIIQQKLIQQKFYATNNNNIEKYIYHFWNVQIYTEVFEAWP